MLQDRFRTVFLVLKRTCEHVGLQNILATKNCCESDDPYNIIMVTVLNQRG